jgi:hypothetical protein
VRVDFGIDLDELTLSPQKLDPGAQVARRHEVESNRGPLNPRGRSHATSRAGGN